MAENELGRGTRRKSDEGRTQLQTDAADLLRARLTLREALPPGYGNGPAIDMLLWLYLHPDDTEARLYQGVDLSRSQSSASRWLMVLLKDGLAAWNAKGLALTDAGTALLEGALAALSSMGPSAILQ